MNNNGASLARRIRLAMPAVLLCALLVLTAKTFAVDVEDVRVWHAPDHTRVVLDLSDIPAFKEFTLSDPNRVVVDIQNARLKVRLEDVDLNRSSGSLRSPIKKIRGAVRNKNNIRLVFEVSERVRVDSFLLPANQQSGDRLVIDLFDRESKVVAVKVAHQNKGKRDIIVAIDAGHGGEDPGALGPKKVREKTVVLAIARAIKEILDKRPGYRAILVRDGDYYIGLSKRRGIARENQADLFISIHADAFTDKAVSGSSVYTLSQRGSSSAMAHFLAKSENNTDLIGGVLADKDDMLATVLLDMSMNATRNRSVIVGKEILQEIKRVTKLHKNTVEHAGFAVLKSPDIPSVLIETGFISNPKEARRLSAPKHQQALARAVVNGTTAFFDRHAVEGTMVYWLNHGGAAGHTLVASDGGKDLPRTYKIKSGDTLSELARRFSVSLSELRRYNSIFDDEIRIGQVLKIPPRP